jgi:hypothetical protein
MQTNKQGKQGIAQASAVQTSAVQTSTQPTQAQHTASAQTTTTGKYSTLPNVCAICGKPILGGCIAGTIGSTCTAHIGKVGAFYKPAPATVATNPGFVTLVQLCNHAQTLGFSRGFAVKLTGGDAGTKPASAPVFTVFTIGKRKYVASAALAALTALAKK